MMVLAAALALAGHADGQTPFSPVPVIEAAAVLAVAEGTVPDESDPTANTGGTAPVEHVSTPSDQPPTTHAEAPDFEGPVIVVEGQQDVPGDPLSRLNAQTFEVTEKVDAAVVEPLATGYQEGIPRPVRKGLFNFFSNLREPVVFLNFLLQGKPGKAAETLGRFAINSTIGVAGLVDVARKEPFNLPRRRNGFANTLAVYGVKEGAFLVVPLVGPTTVRDLVGTLVDNTVVPTIAGKPFTEPYVALPAFTVVSLESRIEIDEKLKQIRDSDEPYATLRETYLCERRAEIAALRNRPV
ncbi:MAG: VacJ family lipoprotein, partial [Sphingomonadaceae bacterium]|nr:VacJ family lipoprotein [Sphingomonadaceae bacterium]